MWGMNLVDCSYWLSGNIRQIATQMGSSFSFQHSLCCDFSLILFGSNLPALLSENKGSPSHAKTVAEF